MINSPLLRFSIIAVSTSFLLTGYSLADEKYDVKAYGPKIDMTWNKPVKATFSHKAHTMEAELECTDCHDDLFSKKQGTAVKSQQFTMKAMADGHFCGSCHDGDTAFAIDTNCRACHIPSEEPITWYLPTKVAFSHKSHVEEFELECESCHSKIFTMKKGTTADIKNFTMSAFKEGKYCGSCHNGDDAFDSASQCESCHFPPTEKIVFTQPVNAVVFDHNIHVKKSKISCESCHKEVFAMKQGTVEGHEQIHSDDPAEKRKYLEALHSKFCGSCHDSSQAFGYLTRCTVCHVGVKGLKKLNKGDEKSEAHGKSSH